MPPLVRCGPCGFGQTYQTPALPFWNVSHGAVENPHERTTSADVRRSLTLVSRVFSHLKRLNKPLRSAFNLRLGRFTEPPEIRVTPGTIGGFGRGEAQLAGQACRIKTEPGRFWCFCRFSRRAAFVLLLTPPLVGAAARRVPDDTDLLLKV
ncbi:hypothetical protein SRHO_G00165080 [Serrasalmus rhombeus]